MAKSETREWGGKTWRRWPEASDRSSRQYFQRCTSAGNLYLHRVVYEDAYGAIPSGMHIHHINGDCGDNRIENLECLTAKEHRAKHPLKGASLDRQLAHLDRIRPLAAAWHSTTEGKRLHSRNGRAVWEGRVARDLDCDQCGKPFKSNAMHHAERFCSNKCKSAWRRASGLDDVLFKCPVCHGEKMRSKYSRAKTCSRKCGQRLQDGQG